jgi:hypothetical protein
VGAPPPQPRLILYFAACRAISAQTYQKKPKKKWVTSGQSGSIFRGTPPPQPPDSRLYFAQLAAIGHIKPICGLHQGQSGSIAGAPPPQPPDSRLYFAPRSHASMHGGSQARNCLKNLRRNNTFWATTDLNHCFRICNLQGLARSTRWAHLHHSPGLEVVLVCFFGL